MNEFKKRKITILFVSHSLERIKSFCNRAIYIKGGKIRLIGLPSEVIKKYQDEEI